MHYLFFITLILLSPFFLWLSWPPNTGTVLIFFSLVPQLLFFKHFIENRQGKKYLFLISMFLSNFLWNATVTYWLYNTSLVTGIAIQIVNSVMFTIPWGLYSYSAKLTNKDIKYILLVSSWVSLEYIQYHWFLSYPFLNLGNALSTRPHWIQFMEYTGVLGGTLWVLLSNLSVFKLIEKVLENGFKPKAGIHLVQSIVTILVPIGISIVIFNKYEENGEEVDVLIIHPNVNCRDEKYIMSQSDLINKYLQLTLEKISSNTDFILWPETAIPNMGWMIDLSQNRDLQRIYNDLSKFDKANLITGGILYEQSNYSKDFNLNYHEPFKIWYRTYNAAVKLSVANNVLDVRTKEKLVPVEETTPNKLTYFLRKTFSSLGGFRFSHQKKGDDFFITENGVHALSMICYESLYGQFTAEKLKNEKSIIFILLNEGWYRNIVGASQFMYYSCIRAIESRRSIARSSNDGISCTINQKGQIENKLSSFSPQAINVRLELNNKRTFYSIFGDYLGKLSVVVFFISFVRMLFFKTK